MRFSLVTGAVLFLVLMVGFNANLMKENQFAKTITLDDLKEAKQSLHAKTRGHNSDENTTNESDSRQPPSLSSENETAQDASIQGEVLNRVTGDSTVTNLVNMVAKVQSSSGSSTAVLTDSKTHGYYNNKGSTACTEIETNPWFEVNLGGEFTVRSIELWPPKKSCESIKFKGRCEKAQDVMIISKSSPMKIEVLTPDKEVSKSFNITTLRAIYSWDDVDASAQFVRISIEGAKKQRLCATEVKVFVADDDFQLCDTKTCKFGKCKCLDEACKQKKCACNSANIGEHDCMANPLQDWRYFPIEKTAGGKSWNWDHKKFNQVTSKLKALQNPANKSCSLSKVNGVHGLIGAQGRGAGLASTLHFISGHLSEAYRTKKAFVFGGRMNYAGTKFCKDKDMYGDPDCYFEPIAGESCLKTKGELRKTYKSISGPSRHPNRCAIGKLCNDVGHFRYLPKDFEASGMGLLHFRAAIVSTLVQMNNATKEILNLEKLKEEIGFQHPIIGVHIRHGDACHTTDRKGRCKGLSYYLPEIRTLAARYNTSRVFIATDDENIINSTNRYKKEFQFVYASSFSRDLFDSKDQIEYRKDLWTGNNNKGHSIMLSSLIDLMLLADSDYLVLHLLSNMSRLALELAAARKEAIPAYFSMDGPWCQHWKMCTS